MTLQNHSTKEIIGLAAALWEIIDCAESNNLAVAGDGLADTTAGGKGLKDKTGQFINCWTNKKCFEFQNHGTFIYCWL